MNTTTSGSTLPSVQSRASIAQQEDIYDEWFNEMLRGLGPNASDMDTASIYTSGPSSPSVSTNRPDDPMDIVQNENQVKLLPMESAKQLKGRASKYIRSITGNDAPLLLGPSMQSMQSGAGMVWHQLAKTRRIIPENGSQTKAIYG
jgi:hypothetical protein